jgi:hypothetical protein
MVRQLQSTSQSQAAAMVAQEHHNPCEEHYGEAGYLLAPKCLLDPITVRFIYQHISNNCVIQCYVTNDNTITNDELGKM